MIIDRDLVWKYLEWVLEMKPEVGLSLFIQRQKKKEADGSSGRLNKSRDIENHGIVAELEHEEVLQYLKKLEDKLLPTEEDDLGSKKEEVWSRMFPYRERYLEHVVSLGENIEKYQTMLA